MWKPIQRKHFFPEAKFLRYLLCVCVLGVGVYWGTVIELGSYRTGRRKVCKLERASVLHFFAGKNPHPPPPQKKLPYEEHSVTHKAIHIPAGYLQKQRFVILRTMPSSGPSLQQSAWRHKTDLLSDVLLQVGKGESRERERTRAWALRTFLSFN